MRKKRKKKWGMLKSTSDKRVALAMQQFGAAVATVLINDHDWKPDDAWNLVGAAVGQARELRASVQAEAAVAGVEAKAKKPKP